MVGRTNETNTSGEEIRKAKKVEELTGMSFEGDVRCGMSFVFFPFWVVGCVLVEHSPNLRMKGLWVATGRT